MSDRPTPEQIARDFHEAYEMLAPLFGYKTRSASAVPWDQVPQSNRDLMVATVRAVINERGRVIVHPDDIPTRDPDEDEGGPDYWARGWNRCRQVVFGVSDE